MPAATSPRTELWARCSLLHQHVEAHSSLELVGFGGSYPDQIQDMGKLEVMGITEANSGRVFGLLVADSGADVQRNRRARMLKLPVALMIICVLRLVWREGMKGLKAFCACLRNTDATGSVNYCLEQGTSTLCFTNARLNQAREHEPKGRLWVQMVRL